MPSSPKDARASSTIEDTRPTPVAQEQAEPANTIIDLRVLFKELWRRKLLILLSFLMGGLIGLWDLRNFVPKYEAHMIVGLPETFGSSPAQRPSGQLSQLANNFNLGIGGAPESEIFARFEVLRSSLEFARLLQDKYKLMQRIYQNSWDPQEQKWIRPSGWQFNMRERINRFFKLRTWREPTLQSLSNTIGASVTASDMTNLLFKRISVVSTDPEFALDLLKIVYNEADKLIRAQDRKETISRRQYLEERLNATSLSDFRHGLVGLLISEERKAMMLDGDMPYIGRVIVPPVVTETPSTPSIPQLLGLPIFITGMLGVSLVTVIFLFRRE